MSEQIGSTTSTTVIDGTLNSNNWSDATSGGLVIHAFAGTSLPPGMANAVLTAIDYFEGEFHNDVTMNLDFDWKPISGVAESNTALSQGNYSGVLKALVQTDSRIPSFLAGTRKGLNLRLSALLDGESAGWGSDAGVEGAI